VYPLLLFIINFVPNMTYNVFGGTLNLAQSINQSLLTVHHHTKEAGAVCGRGVLYIFNSWSGVGVMQCHWQLLLEKIMWWKSWFSNVLLVECNHQHV